jgi:hypothetical protein
MGKVGWTSWSARISDAHRWRSEQCPSKKLHAAISSRALLRRQSVPPFPASPRHRAASPSPTDKKHSTMLSCSCSRTARSTICWAGLYGPGEVKSFEGVIGKDLKNPIPEWAEHGADRKFVPYGIAPNMNTPKPDSGEEYPHINTDLFGIQDPRNRFVPLSRMVAPYNAPDDPRQQPTMDGFVTLRPRWDGIPPMTSTPRS